MRNWPRSLPTPEAVYRYTDEAGELVAEIGRFTTPDGKTFRVRQPAPDRPGYWLMTRPPQMPLYRLPAVLEAVAAGQPVYLTEGEKDADALTAAGQVATSKPFGAVRDPAEWADHWSLPLKGARVIIVADRDEAGYRHAACVRHALADVAAEVTVVRTPIDQPHADVTDHLAAGLPLAALEPVPADLLPAPAADPDPGAAVVPFPRRSGRGSGKPAPATGLVRVPMSTGTWCYSTGAAGADLPRGLYRQVDGRWEQAAELPYVLERIHHRDGSGARRSISYRLAMTPAGESVVCDGEEVRTGEWAERLAVPLSGDDKIVKAAAYAIRDAGRREGTDREAIPRWSESGELALPPADVGPRGYAETNGDEPAARQAWQEIAALLAANPRAALTVGVTLAAPFMAPLRRPGFAFLLVGGSSQGKSSTLYAAAALLGDPTHVAPSWSTSGLGLPALAGELSCLPILRDEMSASGLTAKELGTQIIRLAEGAQRTTGRRRGGSQTTPTWRSVLVGTGNEGILGRAPQEALFARVIQLSTPIIATAEQAQKLERLAREFYGWPLRWLTAGWDLPGFAALLEAAETELPLPGGGVERRLAAHLALGVAGAARLEQIVGAPVGMRAAALAAARETLADLVEELRERGMRPGERLLAAVVEAVASRPAAYPPLHGWREAVEGGAELRVREFEGYVRDLPGGGREIGVLTQHLDRLAVAAGIDDPLPGLRELRSLGVLATTTERDGRLVSRPRLAPGVRPRVYAFRLSDADPEKPPAAPPPAAPPPAAPPPAAPPPAVAEQPDPTPETNNRAPAVVLDLAYAYLALSQPRAVPHGLTTLAEALNWAAAENLGVPGPPLRDGTEYRRLADDGQVWLMPDLAEDLGLPATPPADDAAASRLRSRLAAELEPHGWRLGAGGGARWWLYVFRDGGRGLRLVLPGWSRGRSDCPLLGEEGQLDAAGIARRIAAYVERIGTPWVVSGAVTGLRLVDRTRVRAAARLTEPAEAPPPARGVRAMRERPAIWQRPPAPDELAMPYVHAYDKNGMYLSAMSSVELGLGEAEHQQSPEFNPKIPGYWLVDPPEWQHSRLPSPFEPDISRSPVRGPIWLTTPTLRAALELGWWDGSGLQEAYVWPRHARYLEPAYRVLRDARQSLLTATDPDAAAILEAVKGTYTGLVGKFGQLTAVGAREYRPDWQHHVMSLARANLLRTLATVAEQTGRYPLAVLTDCVLYASSDPDPVRGAPSALPGFRSDAERAELPLRKLGRFKPVGTAPTERVAELLTAPRVHRDLMSLFEE